MALALSGDSLYTDCSNEVQTSDSPSQEVQSGSITLESQTCLCGTTALNVWLTLQSLTCELPKELFADQS